MRSQQYPNRVGNARNSITSDTIPSSRHPGFAGISSRVTVGNLQTKW